MPHENRIIFTTTTKAQTTKLKGLWPALPLCVSKRWKSRVSSKRCTIKIDGQFLDLFDLRKKIQIIAWPISSCCVGTRFESFIRYYLTCIHHCTSIGHTQKSWFLWKTQWWPIAMNTHWNGRMVKRGINWTLKTKYNNLSLCKNCSPLCMHDRSPGIKRSHSE